MLTGLLASLATKSTKDVQAATKSTKDVQLAMPTLDVQVGNANVCTPPNVCSCLI
jgi:hypothetical protein